MVFLNRKLMKVLQYMSKKDAFQRTNLSKVEKVIIAGGKQKKCWQCLS